MISVLFHAYWQTNLFWDRKFSYIFFLKNESIIEIEINGEGTPYSAGNMYRGGGLYDFRGGLSAA